jgi:hypothetical protein
LAGFGFALAPYFFLACASQAFRFFLGSFLHALSALASSCALVGGFGFDCVGGATGIVPGAAF